MDISGTIVLDGLCPSEPTVYRRAASAHGTETPEIVTDEWATRPSVRRRFEVTARGHVADHVSSIYPSFDVG